MLAKIVEKSGFDAVYMTGYGTSLNYLGMTDVGLLTGTEMIQNAKYIANAVRLPVIADADTGYGNALNVMRTVREYEEAGVAAMHLEDQTFPKRCGHLPGKKVIPIEEAVGKIKAAVDAKQNKDFVIIARTDSIGAIGGSIAEGVRRASAYAEAGADMIFAEFPAPSKGDAEKFSGEFRKSWPKEPLLFNYSSSFKWSKAPALRFKELGEMGYKLIIVSLATLRPTMKAVWDHMQDLKQNEDVAVREFEKSLEGHFTEDFHEFAGFSEVKRLENTYLPKTDPEGS